MPYTMHQQVRVVRLIRRKTNALSGEAAGRLPNVGDVGYVVDVYTSPHEGYCVEGKDRDQTIWLADFEPEELEALPTQNTTVLDTMPLVKAQMLVRRPIAEVFDAFVDPDITTKFWFTHSNGTLERDKTIRWNWEMYDVSVDVLVKEVDPHHRILIEWGDTKQSVEWQFSSYSDKSTLVRIINKGFDGNKDDAVAQAIDSMGGFTMVLAGLKAYLEHKIELNLIADHNPDAQRQKNA